LLVVLNEGPTEGPGILGMLAVTAGLVGLKAVAERFKKRLLSDKVKDGFVREMQITQKYLKLELR
jgi:hypothetical protein